MSERDAKRAELESLRSEWCDALLAARKALRAEKGVLPHEELAAHERHLRDEYKAVAAELRQFARDEGLRPELAEPFPPGSSESGGREDLARTVVGCDRAGDI
jgi:hypothetical protein